MTIIPLGAALLLRSSNQPEDGTGRPIVPLFGLAPGGVCRASRVTTPAVGFYPTVSPLLSCLSGLVSVTLSLGSRRMVVSHRRTLWSPDFPHAYARDRPVI